MRRRSKQREEKENRKEDREKKRGRRFKRSAFFSSSFFVFFFFFTISSFFMFRGLRELVLAKFFNQTDEVLQNARQSLSSLSRLTTVYISELPGLLPYLTSSASSLRELVLHGLQELDFSIDLNYVVHFPYLRVLRLFNIAHLSQALFDRVCELRCGTLEQLSVTSVNNISSLRCLSLCSRLTFLDLSDCDSLGKDELVHLTGLANLVRRRRIIRNKKQKEEEGEDEERKSFLTISSE